MQAIVNAQIIAAALVILATKAMNRIPVRFMRTVKFKGGRIATIYYLKDHTGRIFVKTRGLPTITIVPRPTNMEGQLRYSAKVSTFRFFGMTERAVYQQAVACAWN